LRPMEGQTVLVGYTMTLLSTGHGRDHCHRRRGTLLWYKTRVWRRKLPAAVTEEKKVIQAIRKHPHPKNKKEKRTKLQSRWQKIKKIKKKGENFQRPLCSGNERSTRIRQREKKVTLQEFGEVVSRNTIVSPKKRREKGRREGKEKRLIHSRYRQ